MKLKDGMLILPFTVFMLAPVFSSEYSCKDMFFNDCHYPPPFTAIHATDLKNCDKVCEIYGTINSCTFYMFSNNNAIDENCQLYTYDTPISQFVKGCNLVGMPILDSYGGRLSEQEIEDVCFEEECGGYIQTECDNIGHGEIIHKFNTESLDSCIEKCSKEYQIATFVTFKREEKECECFENGYRDCVDEVVTYETDIDTCYGYHNPTTAQSTTAEPTTTTAEPTTTTAEPTTTSAEQITTTAEPTTTTAELTTTELTTTTAEPTTTTTEPTSSVKPETYSCKDMFFNDCQYPPVLAGQIHTPNIEECNIICQEYGWFNSCSFYNYFEADYMVNNCKIYAGENLEDFVLSCNVIGLPIMDSDGTCFSQQMSCVEVEEECTGCTPCLAEDCGGYIQTECRNIGNGTGVLDTFYDTEDINACSKTCRENTNGKATFVTFNKSERICECYENGSRECLNDVITIETDYQYCQNYHD